MNKQLIEKLETLKEKLIFKSIKDAELIQEAIQSLQPKEQVNQEYVKLPLSGESKLSADITDYQRLFDYMHIEHNVILLQTDMQEIARIVMHDFANNSEAIDESFIEWYVTNVFYRNSDGFHRSGNRVGEKYIIEELYNEYLTL